MEHSHFYVPYRATRWCRGRNYVVPEDFKTVAVPVLAHRLTMQIGADDGRAAESVIEEILNRIDLPTENWSGR